MAITTGNKSVDAAIAAITKQRNDALDNVAQLAAELASLADTIDALKNELELKKREMESIRSEQDVIDTDLVEATVVAQDE